MLKMKAMKLNPQAKLPEYANPGDAGMDLYSVETCVIPPGEARLIKTGVAIELPPETEAQVRPRSGLALNHSITVLNSPGTIDEGYRGELCVILINHGSEQFLVETHMRIAQLVVKPVYRVSIEEAGELSDSGRGTKGFGSSGLK